MTENELNKKPLYELRRIGRQIGVKASSSLKKSVLIERIIDVESGKIPPTFSSRGRPTLLYEKKVYFNNSILKEINRILKNAKNEIISLLIEKR